MSEKLGDQLAKERADLELVLYQAIGSAIEDFVDRTGVYVERIDANLIDFTEMQHPARRTKLSKVHVTLATGTP